MKNNDVPFHLLKINREDSEMGFTVEVNPEFESWFLKSHGLNEWDEVKFQTWFKAFLTDAVKDRLLQESGNRYLLSEQQRVDVYSRDGLDDG